MVKYHGRLDSLRPVSLMLTIFFKCKNDIFVLPEVAQAKDPIQVARALVAKLEKDIEPLRNLSNSAEISLILSQGSSL